MQRMPKSPRMIGGSKKCYDFVNLEERENKEYLAEDPDNVILKYRDQYFCKTRTELKNALSDPTSIFWQCTPHDFTGPYIKVYLQFNVFVPLMQYVKCVFSQSKKFYVSSKPVFDIKRTASDDFVRQENRLAAVGGAHCTHGIQIYFMDMEETPDMLMDDPKSFADEDTRKFLDNLYLLYTPPEYDDAFDDL